MRALLFDVDDTLVDRAGAVRRAFARWIDERPVCFHQNKDALPLPADGPRASRAGKALAHCLAVDAGGTRGRDEVARDLISSFPRLADDGAACADIEAELTHRLLAAVAPRPEVTRLVDDLRKTYPIAVVSNGSGSMQREKLARAGLIPYLDTGRLFISGERGFAKPDPRIFLAALDRLDIPPAAALHVGDDPERDVAGAARAGLRACWISHGRPWPSSSALPKPTYTIASITHLAPLLAELSST